MIECIPNISTSNAKIIKEIAQVIDNTTGCQVLHIDTNKDTNRTVLTFCGEEDSVFQAGYKLIEIARQQIDMTKHLGAHPRIGAVDVFPFVNLNGANSPLYVDKHRTWAKMINQKLDIPIYLYEDSTDIQHRKNLANLRKGQYENLPIRMLDKDWVPDFLVEQYNEKFGAMVTGYRPFLIAFNISINSKDITIAKKMANDIRYSSSSQYALPFVKAIGWYMEEYECAQVSMNICNPFQTTLFQVIYTIENLCTAYQVELTECELIGLMPQKIIDSAIQDFGCISFEEFQKRIKLKYKSNTIPSIENHIQKNYSLETLLSKM